MRIDYFPTSKTLVLTGGYAGSTYFNSVWKSTDAGATWMVATITAAWAGRNYHATVTKDSTTTLAVLAGLGTSSGVSLQDIWTSTNYGGG